MQPVAVGALHDQNIGALADRLRVANDRDVRTADIAAEHEAALLVAAFFINIEDDMGAAQHMAGIHQGEGNAGKDLAGPVIAYAHKLVHGPGRICLGVERLKGPLALFLAAAVDVFHILFLDRGAVLQHHRAQIAGGRGAENVALKAVFDQAGDAARVIDVGMGKDQAVNMFALAESAAVFLKGVLAFALNQAAVKHDGLPVDFEQMLRAGDGTCCAIKGKFHGLHLSSSECQIVIACSVRW